MLCCTERLVLSARSTHNPIQPYEIIKRLRSITRHFVLGQQQDAHEFCRYAIQALKYSLLV